MATKKFEVEKCECGHTAPLGFVRHDEDGNGDCMNCFAEYLEQLLKKERKKVKKLRAEMKKINTACGMNYNACKRK